MLGQDGITGSATGTSLVFLFFTGAKNRHPAKYLTCTSTWMILRRKIQVT